MAIINNLPITTSNYLFPIIIEVISGEEFINSRYIRLVNESTSSKAFYDKSFPISSSSRVSLFDVISFKSMSEGDTVRVKIHIQADVLGSYHNLFIGYNKTIPLAYSTSAFNTNNAVYLPSSLSGDVTYYCEIVQGSSSKTMSVYNENNSLLGSGGVPAPAALIALN